LVSKDAWGAGEYCPFIFVSIFLKWFDMWISPISEIQNSVSLALVNYSSLNFIKPVSGWQFQLAQKLPLLNLVLLSKTNPCT